MNNTIKARRVSQNNQEFLIGTFQIREVQNFTKYTEHLIIGYEDIEDENKVYEGQRQVKPYYNPEIQRKTNNAKIEKIADYLISDSNAMFPTNIVIAIPHQVIDAMEESQSGETIITLNPIVQNEIKKNNGDVFLTIIDGQHRVRGIERAIERLKFKLSDLNKVLSTSDNEMLRREFDNTNALLSRLLEFELVVSFFIDPTLEYQAMIFSTINKTQTKVPENLVFSLFGLSKDDSPQKTALEVVLALNGIEKSPFYNRIKLVGGSYKKGEAIPLSQATMVKSILFNISNNPRESEVDRTRPRSSLLPNPNNLCFRKYYASNQDQMIVRIMYSFFSAVRECFKDDFGYSHWDLKEGKISNVLHTNVGYQALLRVLQDLLKKINEEEKDKKHVYVKYLSKIKNIDWQDLGQEKRYPFTSSTIKVLYTDILREIY